MTAAMGAASMWLTSCAYKDAVYPGDAGYYYPNGFAEYDQVPENGAGDKFEDFADNAFISTSEQPVSTFSVDADGASYAYMRASLNRNNLLPYKSAVRIEEFLNYFTFDYANSGEDVSINAEIGDCPWNADHKLLRLGMKGKDVSENQAPDANFVFLVDVSGSMSSRDKLELLKSGLITLVDYMRPTDRIAIVTYSGSVTCLLESTPCSQASTIKRAIQKLEAGGFTAGADGMKMAYKQVLDNYIEGGNNRVIMGTDGDFNVGPYSTDSLLQMAEYYAGRGIYLSVMGFGLGNLNDEMMEKVSNHGNGTYNYIDSEAEMAKVFVHERSRFISVANDCKAQVTFDSTMVSAYRLIGYENRVLRTEDFENDSVDAAEIGAGQTITVLYEIVPTAAWNENANLGVFDFRYKQALGGNSIPLSLTLAGWVGSSSENLNFAAGVAAYGMLLRDSEHKGNATFGMALDLVDNNRRFDPHNYRAELVEIIRKAQTCESSDSHWYY